MPVFGTPIAPAAATTIGILAQSTVQPANQTVEGVASLARAQAVVVEQTQDADVQWTFRTATGDAVDLTAAFLPAAPDHLEQGSLSLGHVDTVHGHVRFRLTEALSIGIAGQTIEVYGGVVNAAAGVTAFRLPASVVAQAGVYLINGRIDSAQGRCLMVSQGYLVVTGGQFGDPALSQTAPPTVAEIRLHLRDNGAEDNFLLQTLEWDLPEIAAAMVRCVRVWNESRPILAVIFDTRTFPYTDLWLNGIHAKMYSIAAAAYRREDVRYQAAGVEFADKAKEQVYEARGNQLWSYFELEVKRRKAGLNILSGFRTLRSNYPSLRGPRW